MADSSALLRRRGRRCRWRACQRMRTWKLTWSQQYKTKKLNCGGDKNYGRSGLSSAWWIAIAVTTATTPTAYQTNLLLPALTGPPAAPPLLRLLSARGAVGFGIACATVSPSSVSEAAVVINARGAGTGGTGGPSLPLRTLVISPAFTNTQAPDRLQTFTVPSNTITFMMSLK